MYVLWHITIRYKERYEHRTSRTVQSIFTTYTMLWPAVYSTRQAACKLPMYTAGCYYKNLQTKIHIYKYVYIYWVTYHQALPIGIIPYIWNAKLYGACWVIEQRLSLHEFIVHNADIISALKYVPSHSYITLNSDDLFSMLTSAEDEVFHFDVIAYFTICIQ